MIKPNDDVQLSLSISQYRALVEMIQVADWVITSRETGPRESTKPFREVRRAVLANVAAIGMDKDIVFEDGDYFETLDYESNAPHRELLAEYDGSVFWDELIARLVDRDFQDKFSDAEIAGMTIEKRASEHSQIRATYETEFVNHDLKRLRIAESSD